MPARPKKEGRGGFESMEPTKSRKSSSGGGLFNKPKANDKFDPTKAIGEDNLPMERAGTLATLFGNPANMLNTQALLQQQQLNQGATNQTALAQLHHQLAMQEMDKKIAADIAAEQVRANNALQLAGVQGNINNAVEANRINLQAQDAENKRKLGLQHDATARAALMGDIGGAGQVPMIPDYFDFSRAQEDLLNSEAGQQLRDREAKENADLVQKQTAARYMERGMRAPMSVGQNLIWDPVSGTTSEFDPGQTITMPPGIDRNNPLKKLPGWTKRTPSHLRPIDLSGKGGQTAGQQFIFGPSSETSANTGEVTTQDEAPPAAAPSSPSVPNTIPQVAQPRSFEQLLGLYKPQQAAAAPVQEEDPLKKILSALASQRIMRTY